MPVKFPQGSGTAIFAGGGAWLPRAGLVAGDAARGGGGVHGDEAGRGARGGPWGAHGGDTGRGACGGRRGARSDDALVLSDPCRTLLATTPEQVPALIEEIQTEQHQGRFVAGYLSYEAGAAFGLTVRTPAPDALPLAWMAVYPRESATVIPAAEWRRYLEAIDVSRVAGALAGIKPELSVSRDQYVDAIRRVREFIAAGDTYQVNYTVRGRYELAAHGRGAPGRGTGDLAAPGPADTATSGPCAAGPGAADPATTEAIDPLDYFLALVVRQAVPYAAYLDLGGAQVISLSPEMFLRRDGNQLESRPMKGTRPRGATHAEDVALAYELAETEKERAENLMIVDMVRNDLGRVCRAGSVRVPTLYAVEPYRTVWQMVSTVTGDVHPRSSLGSIMRAVFPGASITGAPKYHTMEIIAALETEARDVYAGAVGCFYPGGDFTTNIAIRTIIHRQGHCKLGTGSGVVWDADAGSEYEETLAKAAFATPPPGDTWRPDTFARLRAAAPAAPSARDALPQEEEREGVPRRPEDPCLFETILLDAREGDVTVEGPPGAAGLSPSLHVSDGAVLARYVFLNEHLDRMAASAQALGFAFDREAALDLLLGLARLTPGAVVVHVELDAAGGLSRSTRPIQHWAAPGTDSGDQKAAAPGAGGPATSVPATLMVSPFRSDPDDPFLRHKTSVRGFYNREYRRAVHLGCVDALFLNRLDRVTEGAISNVAARFGDRWVTPPLEDGLLPGIWRSHLIAGRDATECSLTLPELLAADEIVVGNSVRGAVSVERVIADPVTF